LDGAYRTFAAEIGIDAATSKRGSAIFTVEVDGVATFTSPIMSGGTPARPIQVDVSGAHTLTLVVMPGTDGNTGDWADWAQARLTRGAS
ncbi:MAG: NPCBM/NEW2 domain-containing protein, partial [Gaiellaceae bacterium]